MFASVLSGAIITALAAATSSNVGVLRGGMWCAKPHTFGAISTPLLTPHRVSYRGEYRDFSLYVEESFDLVSNCSVFMPHDFGNDGLWIIEEADEKSVIRTKTSLRSAGLPIYYEQGFSFIVGGGDEVPNVSGLDGCGADEDTSFIPVPSHTIRPPLLSTHQRQQWSNAEYDENVAVGVAEVSEDNLISTITSLQSITTRNSYSSDIYTAQQYLTSALEALGYNVEFMSFRSDMAPNIIATLPQNDAADVVVIGAHYDSRSVNSSSPTDRAPGADDNASGVSAMLELARIIATTSVPLKKSIRVCFFAGEEQGLLGSRALAALWSEQQVPIVAMVNADMLGYQAGDVVTLGFKDKSVTPELVSLAKQLTALYVPTLPTADSSSCCSDYLAFYENGFPAVGFFESGMAASDYPSYHKVTDLLENVNTKQLALETQAVTATVLTLLYQ